MLSTAEIDAAGAALFMQHENREEFKPLSSAVTMEEAQRIQDAYVAKLLKKLDAHVGGYKVALTTKQIREWLKRDEPACGQIISSRIYTSPHVVRGEDYVRLSIEPEICVVLDNDMSGDCTVDDVHKNIRSLHCAYELVEDRGADLGNLDVVSLLADNCWNAGIVMGPAAERSLPLDSRTAHLWVNDGLVATGSTAECLNGNPLHVVAWLSQYLGQQGRSIKAGQPVLTGSIIRTQFLRPGDRAVFEVDGMPPATLTIA